MGRRVGLCARDEPEGRTAVGARTGPVGRTEARGRVVGVRAAGEDPEGRALRIDGDGDRWPGLDPSLGDDVRGGLLARGADRDGYGVRTVG